VIVRVFRARIKAGKLEEWREKVERVAVPGIRSAPGLLAFFPGEPLDPATREFSFVTLWRDLDSLRAYAGAEWQKGAIPPEQRPLVEESWVQHYEAFAHSPVPGAE